MSALFGKMISFLCLGVRRCETRPSVRISSRTRSARRDIENMGTHVVPTDHKFFDWRVEDRRRGSLSAEQLSSTGCQCVGGHVELTVPSRKSSRRYARASSSAILHRLLHLLATNRLITNEPHLYNPLHGL